MSISHTPLSQYLALCLFMFLSLLIQTSNKDHIAGYLTCHSNPRSPSWKKLWTWKSGRSSTSWCYQLLWRRLITQRGEKREKGRLWMENLIEVLSRFRRAMSDIHSWNVEYLLVSCLCQLSISLLSFTIHLVWGSAQQAKNWEVSKWLKV